MKAAADQNPTIITVHVPIMFTVRSGRKSVISWVVTTPAQPRIDNALLKALARAHRWRRMIEGGEYGSITELAKAEGINQSYACRLLRLTLLAPGIVVEILNGRQHSDLMLRQLTEPFPLRWDQQLDAFELGNLE